MVRECRNLRRSLSLYRNHHNAQDEVTNGWKFFSYRERVSNEDYATFAQRLCAQLKISFADHISDLVDLSSVYEEPEDKSNKRLITFMCNLALHLHICKIRLSR